MNAHKRELIRCTLRNLAEAHATTMALMQQTLALLAEEFALDQIAPQKSRATVGKSERIPMVDDASLSITFHGRSCFLGNTLPFRLFARLASRPNAYLTYDDLLNKVWGAVRSDAAVRSAVKSLRTRLRNAGMGDLADAIDGTVPHHYGLKLGG